MTVTLKKPSATAREVADGSRKLSFGVIGGGGGIGASVIGLVATHPHATVACVVRDPKQAESLQANKDGLVLQSGGRTFQPDGIGFIDFDALLVRRLDSVFPNCLVVAMPRTRDVDTRRLLDYVKARHPGTPVILFQNGLPMDLTAYTGTVPIGWAVANWGADQVREDGERLLGKVVVKTTPIAEIGGLPRGPATGRLKAAIDALVEAARYATWVQTGRPDFRYADDVSIPMHKKLLLNCGASLLVPLSVVAARPTSMQEMHDLLQRDSRLFAKISAYILETYSVFQAAGLPTGWIDGHACFDHFVRWLQKSHVPSIVGTFFSGRETEIRFFAGAVADLAVAHGLDAPRNCWLRAFVLAGKGKATLRGIDELFESTPPA